MSELFLTGMFRSGSTTLARALNAHKNIAFASDPYLEIFKLLRSDLSADLNQEIPFMRPLEDYYFSSMGLNLLDKIENSSPQHHFQSSMWPDLLSILKKRCSIYSESLVPYLPKIHGETYQKALSTGLEEIKKCYGDDKTTVTGFKEVWGVEFVPFFLEANPKGKAIILQRDPRAVCASKNKTEEKYPWIFLCRQWRKLAALSWAYAHDIKYKDRILLLNFEDFVLSPKEVTKKICNFLEINWDSNIADASTYKGGDGKIWKQNTSFGGGEANFDKNATKRWKQVLSHEECSYIEYMCAPEMSLHSYAPTIEEKNSPAYWTKNSPRINDEDQANWMRELVPNNKEWIEIEMQKEEMRNELLSLRNISKNEFLIKKNFLKYDAYKEIFYSAKWVSAKL